MILTGLPTQGLPAIQGTTARVSWVKGLFDRLPDEAPEEVVTYHARAFTWVLLGGVLLADRSGDHIPVHILPLVGARGLHALTAGVQRFSPGCTR
ncbi:hypothetical protein LINPERPRIM_LOCUS22631 [Linum perenne]